MTYCFAWKYQDAVFLVADTLVTQSVPAGADRPTTSTGEPHRQLRPTEFVQERQLKFRELKEGTVVAIAGDGRLALAITDFMQDNIASVEEPAAVFAMVEATFGPFDPDRRVQMLLIQGTEEGGTSITKWDTQGGREDATHWAYIGSLAAARAQHMAELFQGLITEQKPSKDAVLLGGMAFVMSKSKHEDLIQENVGGIVYGLRVQRGKTIWPDDLVILQHRGGLLSLEGRISVHARDGIVYINSTYHGSIGTVLVNAHTRVRTEDLMRAWNEKWWPYLRNYLREHFTTCTRWLFINLDRDVPLVFVVHGRLEEASANLRITPPQEDGGPYALTLGLDLFRMFQREPPLGGSALRILEAIDRTKPLPDGMTPEAVSGL